MIAKKIIDRAGRLITGIVVVTVVTFTVQEVSWAQVADLLHELNLTTYARPITPPDFNGRTTAGRDLSLASLKGKVVLFNFWATWCLECRPEMAAFERLHREFSAQGLAVVGINAREKLTTIRSYAKELGLTFPLISDPTGKINSAYGVIGLPTTFLIGRSGRAVGLAIGPRDWSDKAARALIQTLLAESLALKDTP
jgi:cytochrome c biogenesis protein CcmG, thiol:disulfide interchange protein DsbE